MTTETENGISGATTDRVAAQGEGEAVHAALAVAAAKCIDAGMTDDQAGTGLRAALIGLRKRLRLARAI